MKYSLFLILLLISYITCVKNYYELKMKDFANKKVTDKDGTIYDKWFIKFYAPWCPHCQRLAPEWDIVAEQLDGIVKVGGVDCTQEIELCDKFNVFGYPTIMYMEEKVGAVKYEGRREHESLVDYITSEDYNLDQDNKVEVPTGIKSSGFSKIREWFGLN